MTKSRNINAPRQLWTADQVAQLRTLYPHYLTDNIATMIGRSTRSIYQMAASMGLKKSDAYMASPAACRLRRGDNVGAAHRFQPGQVVWNKGKAFPASGRSGETQFKTGSAPANRLPVGHIRINSDGYKDIKTAPGMRKWVPLHRWNWKQAHGEYPARDMALAFRDGNRMNCELTNLELISRGDLMKRNTVHNLPKELVVLIQLTGALNRKINGKRSST